jgi:hypothetical protein
MASTICVAFAVGPQHFEEAARWIASIANFVK